MVNANSQRAPDGSQPTPNDASPPGFSSDTLASQVGFLQEFLESPPPTEEESANNLSTLLKQLDTAEGMAQGVESKLDKLLENLEGVLKGLEGTSDGPPTDGPNATGSNPSGTPPAPQSSTQEKGAG